MYSDDKEQNVSAMVPSVLTWDDRNKGFLHPELVPVHVWKRRSHLELIVTNTQI